MLTRRRNIQPPLLGTIFGPEDGGSTFLRYLGELQYVPFVNIFRENNNFTLGGVIPIFGAGIFI
jgi:hypothetical protein